MQTIYIWLGNKSIYSLWWIRMVNSKKIDTFDDVIPKNR